jgi:glycosyltransferase involved in cell wall biosynthesis
MKILHIINYFQSKLGYQEYFLAKEHVKMGHNVAVITSDRYAPFSDFKETYGKILGKRKCGTGYRMEEGIPTYRLPVLFEIKSGYRIWLRGLESLILKLKPDLIISHCITINSFRIARLRAGGCKFKLIVDDHMWSGVMKKNFVMKTLYKFRKKMIKRILVPWVDKFVGVSQETCDILEKIDGVPKEKIKYIPLGVDTDLFRFNKEGREETREKLNIADNDILLLYTGKINKDKGVDIIVKAFNSLEINRKIYLLLIGGGSKKFKNELINLVGKEKKKDIIFYPFVPMPELSKYYSASDICVWETASISFFEAMSCQRSIICGDAPAIKERVANNNGLTFRTGDHRDLAEKIKYLSENDGLRREMGYRDRKLVEKESSWNKIAQDFINCVMDK